MISLNFFVSDCEKAIEFYKKGMGAEISHTNLPEEGDYRSAKFSINGHLFAIAQASEKFGTKTPNMLGGVPMCIQLFVPDVKGFMDRAIEHGASLGMPSTTEKPIVLSPKGDEFANIVDPDGYYWSIIKG